ncbi:Solitary outer membrane autotransporter beta-barrel domain [Vibrio sp. L3-7]|uniref:Solitary outer membrane autotransporter beta-barrel domain n=1 Tax=Vibrio sp. L3-7 TaxID=2912253 RepID=UPI0011939942|nr:Solitary outer membrane autotransporter beta-barrel domain [Vibrio sp. L3-7]MCF7506444.1 Solitary outer membrane autotransporter beta-barrel domain [Vibrio sp. L3-7]TVU69405.1 Solitary outer membrane autotransporter beta-barrel domain [Vibrio tasmaniensis]
MPHSKLCSRVNINRAAILPLLCFIFPTIGNANSLTDSFRKDLERTFATSVLLNDTDVFTFGINNFDPNKVFSLDNEDIGSKDSVSRRKDITSISLPYTFELPEYIEDNHQEITLRLSALRIEKDISYASTVKSDFQKESVISGYVEFANVSQLDEHWSFSSAIGNHISYYRNDFEYRSPLLEPIKDQLDNVYLNTDAWAYIIEPKIKLTFEDKNDWGKYKLSTSWHYFNGIGWGEANNGNVGYPEGWYIANEAKIFYDLIRWDKNITSMYSSIRRIDIGGDTVASMGTTSYYEGSVGWLLNPNLFNDWVDNVGIGFTINYGSSLKGGSLVIFFNQD